MKSALKILQLVKDYKGKLALYCVFIILSSAFGIVSVAMAIPFLNVIFDRETENSSAIGGVSSNAGDIFDKLIGFIREIKAQEGPQNALIYISIGIILLFFLKNVFRYLAIKVLTPIRSGVIFDLRRKMFEKINRLSVGFFTEQKKGDMLTRLSSDIGEVEWAIMASLSSIIENPVKIILSLAFMFKISPQLSLIMLLVLPVSGVLIGRVGKSLKKGGHSGQSVLDRIMSLADETIGGSKIVRAFTAERFVTQKYITLNKEFTRIHAKMLNRRELSSPMGEFLGSIVVALIMYLGGLLILNASSINSGLTPETFIAFILTFSQLISPAKATANTVYNLQKGMASLERIEELLQQPEKIKDEPGAQTECSFEKEIRFNDVTFAYDQEIILHNISFVLEKGKTLALVGASGAGKSTLSDLLPRFYDVSSGSITIDGRDIRSFTTHSLRKKMGIVPQTSILFNDTVLNNICFGDETPDINRAMDAAKHAHAHDFIMQLDNGYETTVGEGGSRLSGGQRQRIAIARALYKDPDILILDEATSALDSESEKAVQEALETLMQNRTSIVIAHRLSTIRRADQIMVMEGGRILEAGTHEQLLAGGGMYKKMVQLQSFGE
ncbi:MAG: ABC transporter ATP-binding protein [Flavobacteriales bacterium]